jgi:hypothetical protein
MGETFNINLDLILMQTQSIIYAYIIIFAAHFEPTRIKVNAEKCLYI